MTFSALKEIIDKNKSSFLYLEECGMERNKEGLKACPFCGSLDVHISEMREGCGNGYIIKKLYIICNNNKCGCVREFNQNEIKEDDGSITVKAYTREECIEAWNTRV